jgi:hypothetical protein
MLWKQVLLSQVRPARTNSSGKEDQKRQPSLLNHSPARVEPQSLSEAIQVFGLPADPDAKIARDEAVSLLQIAAEIEHALLVEHHGFFRTGPAGPMTGNM